MQRTSHKRLLSLLLTLCMVLTMLPMTTVHVHAGHEDAQECIYCGESRYGDWLCEDCGGCSASASGSCYAENHCPECGNCRDFGLDHCVECMRCDECIGICPNCEMCTDCGAEGFEKMCSDCGQCLACSLGMWCPECEKFECCHGGDQCGGCNKCADCYEKLCPDCGLCNECVNNDMCPDCDKCIYCSMSFCNSCKRDPDCTTVCENCGDYCSECADAFCPNCNLCSECVDVCEGCGEHCSECLDFCEGCSRCRDCVGWEYCHVCELCPECINLCSRCEIVCSDCAEDWCYNCQECSECTEICTNCGDYCKWCADEICEGCGACSNCADICQDCGAVCSECGTICDSCGQYCDKCADFCTLCGEVCSNCTEMCKNCGACENCADICTGCGYRCSDCDEYFCETCGLCSENCATVCTNCFKNCVNCADAFCLECQRCSECTTICTQCGEGCEICATLCPNCGSCSKCETICENCGEHCSGCADVCATCGLCSECENVCEECGLHCSSCANVCGSCSLCEYCADAVCVTCGDRCGVCATICPDCGECEECGHHYDVCHYDIDNHWHVCDCGWLVDIDSHLLKNWVTDKPATATEDGSRSRTCFWCDYTVREVIPAAHEHTKSDWIIDTPATVAAEGSKHKECTVCGAVLETAVIPKIPESHTHGEFVYKHDGVNHWRECGGCGHKDRQWGHLYGEWTIEPATCTADGYRWRECLGYSGEDEDVCDYVQVVMLDDPAIGHTTSGWIVDTPATATVEGLRHKECTACGALLETEVIPAKGGGGGGGGGSIAVTNFTLTFNTNGGGAIAGLSGASGTVIDLSAYKPVRDGYTFAGWFEDNALTKAITSVTLKANTMVYAKWTPKEAAETMPFTDVSESDWFYKAVKYAYEGDLMSGTGDTSFSPYSATTRGMIVTILYRLEGLPAAGAANPFADVAAGKWYADAVVWATEHKIASGYGDSRFGPEDAMTREQMAVILMNYAKLKGYDVTARAGLSQFTDAGSISSWATDAMSWAGAAGLIQGDGTNLMPTGNATRAQVAAILQRFIESVVK